MKLKVGNTMIRFRKMCYKNHHVSKFRGFCLLWTKTHVVCGNALKKKKNVDLIWGKFGEQKAKIVVMTHYVYTSKMSCWASLSSKRWSQETISSGSSRPRGTGSPDTLARLIRCGRTSWTHQHIRRRHFFEQSCHLRLTFTVPHHGRVREAGRGRRNSKMIYEKVE